MLKYSVGADPEMFLMDANGKLRASCGLIGGTKAQPQPLGIGDGFMVQEDNVAVEFNIPPSYTAEEFSLNLRRAIKEIADGVKQMYNFEVVNLSAASFPDDQLVAPAAKEFGCDPDFNAWTEKKNPRPQADDPNLRSCGGHVHIGYDKDAAKFTVPQLIRACDLFLGIPSVLMDAEGDKRRILYGGPGAFRDKPYGCEYRTLSNFWVFDDKTKEWVFRNVGRAIEAVESRSIEIDSQMAIREAIEKNNKPLAKMLVDTYKLEVL